MGGREYHVSEQAARMLGTSLEPNQQQQGSRKRKGQFTRDALEVCTVYGNISLKNEFSGTAVAFKVGLSIGG